MQSKLISAIYELSFPRLVSALLIKINISSHLGIVVLINNASQKGDIPRLPNPSPKLSKNSPLI